MQFQRTSAFTSNMQITVIIVLMLMQNLRLN